MACSGEDILNIDIDPDLLIGLVGKLSLNNIPDFSETLHCLESDASIAPLENDPNTSFVPLPCDISSFNFTPQISCSSNTLTSSNSLSSIPLQCNISSFNHPAESAFSGSSINMNSNLSSVPLALQCDISGLEYNVESSCSSSSITYNSSSCVTFQNDVSSYYYPVENSGSSCSSNLNISSSIPSQCDIPSFSHSTKSSSNNLLSLNNNQSKDGFLSAIGLQSSPRTNHTQNTSSLSCDSLDDSSNSCDSLVFNNARHKESCKEKLVKSKKGATAKTNRKVAFLENSTCDNAESHWHNLPFFPGANFPHKSVNNLQDVFSAGGMVYDIQLSDIGSNLPFNTYSEALPDVISFCQSDRSKDLKHEVITDGPKDLVEKNACSSWNHDSHITSYLQQTEKSDQTCVKKKVCNSLNRDPDDLVEKSVCSPDSGISTSPCPGALSPFSPQTDDSEEYDESHYEDDLEVLLAELIEIENSLKSAEVPQSNVHIPFLKDSKNAEDHKNRIMSFLKEPIFNDLKCQLSLLRGEDEKLTFPELQWESSALRDDAEASKSAKKPSPRSKKHKLGMEFKSAVKTELGRHSSIFSKGRHFSSRSKILKQIQDDERIQKQVKLIQKLIVSKKLKRMDSDERENKKRRIHFTEPCDKSQEDLGYE